jgi:glutaredoxin
MKYYKIIAKKDCYFCLKARLLLMEHAENFEFCDLDQSPELLLAYKAKYNHTTVPMILCKDTESRYEKFIGGFSDLVEFFYNSNKQEEN